LEGFHEWSHREDEKMDAASKVSPKVSPKQLAESLRPEVESFLESVMDAVNEAPDGEWIVGSEEQVRNLSARFRKRVFQEAVQQRIDAAEAAFPPSAANGHRSGHEAGRDQTAGQ
jgi:hypothetical protein